MKFFKAVSLSLIFVFSNLAIADVECWVAVEDIYDIHKIISSYWRTPIGVKDRGKAKIEMELDITGSVVGVILIETSGDNVFDQKLIDVIRKSGPFSNVEKYDEEVRSKCLTEIELSFENPMIKIRFQQP